MQVFVKRSSLGEADPVPVISHYSDIPLMSASLHGGEYTVMILPPSAVDMPQNAPFKLKSDWRDNMATITQNEAYRRIEDVFPTYMQTNANSDINYSTNKYGVDTSVWPQDAKDRKAENDRGWNYVGAVRQTSDALASQVTLTDPTGDAHWPVRISPVYIPPVP